MYSPARLLEEVGGDIQLVGRMREDIEICGDAGQVGPGDIPNDPSGVRFHLHRFVNLRIVRQGAAWFLRGTAWIGTAVPTRRIVTEVLFRARGNTVLTTPKFATNATLKEVEIVPAVQALFLGRLHGRVNPPDNVLRNIEHSRDVLVDPTRHSEHPIRPRECLRGVREPRSITGPLEPADGALQPRALNHAEQAAERDARGLTVTGHGDRSPEMLGEETTLRGMLVRVGEIDVERGTLRVRGAEHLSRIDAELGEPLAALTILTNVARRAERRILALQKRNEGTPRVV